MGIQKLVAAELLKQSTCGFLLRHGSGAGQMALKRLLKRPNVVGGYDVSLRDVTNKPKHTYDGDGPLNVT